MNDDLSREELNRVDNALNALSQHNNQPTKEGWDTIMEEANKQRGSSSKRMKVLAIAAGIAVIAAVISTVLVISNPNSSNNPTADEGRRETPTTKPISSNQKLINNSIILEENFEKVATNDGSVKNNFNIIDGKTNEVLNSISSEKFSLEPLEVIDVSDNEIVFGKRNGCGATYETSVYHIKSNSFEKTGNELRTYSPSGNKYITVTRDCAYISLTGDASSNFKGYEWELVDTKTGERKPFPQGSASNPAYVQDIHWIDNDNVLVEKRDFNMTFNAGSDPRNFEKVDTSSELTLTNKIDYSLPSLEEGTEEISDIKVDGDFTYLLVVLNSEGCSDIYVREISDKENIWAVKLNTDLCNADAWAKNLQFGSDRETVYGSKVSQNQTSSESFDHKAFIYSRKSGNSLYPKGYLVVPKK